MKAAFGILARECADSDEEEHDHDNDGQIDFMELRAFRDDDRKLGGKGLPEFIHKTDQRFAGLSPEQKQEARTNGKDGYMEKAEDKHYRPGMSASQRRDCLFGFKADDDEIDDMVLVADKDVRRLFKLVDFHLALTVLFVLCREKARLTTMSLLR